MQYKLSFLIPSRSEEFLVRTIQDLLENTSEETEILVGLDGWWPKPGIPQHERVNVLYVPEAIGQRALTNRLCKLSKARYVCKIDAHCCLDKDWDKKMFEAFEQTGDDVTMIPIMRNLHCFDWKCYKCGKRIYQDKGNICPCGHKMKKKMVWIGKEKPQSTSYCFDSEPHFQYFNEHTKTEKYKEELKSGITETMSIQGSCFMMTREKYWELNICDEKMGSWGSQGIEVAMKTKLSGGKAVVNHNTWYAHMFRTKSETFGFPYPQSGKQVQVAKSIAKDTFFNNKWDKQVFPLSKVLDEFYPVKGWSDEDIQALKSNELETERSGIYLIKNKKNRRIYIGSAINIKNRIFEHTRKLKQNDHCNIHLQRSWNKYGEGEFEFKILYFCSEEDLLKYEQKYIDEYKEKVGWKKMFNINPHAGSSLGRECSEETKKRISMSMMGKPSWCKGLTKLTDERLMNISEKTKGRNYWKFMEHPRGMLGKKHSEETKDKIIKEAKVIASKRERNSSGQFVSVN